MQPLAKNVEEIGLEVLPVSVLMVNLMEMESIAILVITHVLNALLAQPIVFNAKEIDKEPLIAYVLMDFTKMESNYFY
jgi:hypothetical protein